MENGSLTSVAVVVVVGIVERVGPCPDCMREKLERGAVDGEMEYQSRLSGTPCLWFADVSVSSQTVGLFFHTVHLWCVPSLSAGDVCHNI